MTLGLNLRASGAHDPKFTKRLTVFAERPIYDNHANYQVGQGGQQSYVDKVQSITVLGNVDAQKHHADEEAHG